MTENEPVFGRPVEGKITRGSERAAQAKPERLIAALDKVLGRPDVEAVRWTQYTQYWNDGEPTEFAVHEYEVSVKPVWSIDFLNVEDGLNGTYNSDPSLTWAERYDHVVDDHDTRELSVAIDPLVVELCNGTHYTFLIDAFGDHAEVTATPEGFEVSFYDHE